MSTFRSDRRAAVAAFLKCVLLGTLLLSVQLANADTIIVQSGRRYDGDFIFEDANIVTLRVDVPGSSLSFTQQITKSHIRSWDRADRQGAAYVQIPVVGEIGTDVTTDSIRQALAEAKQYHPQYVVLVFDSNGGQVATTFEILDLLADASRDFKIAASVKKAYSAAAMIAMSCKDIYMMPGSVLGAAVPMKLTNNGPRDIEAKFASAIEAKARTYVVAAGHDDLLLRGMMEMNLEIYLSQKDGKPVLTTAGPGTLLKPRGQILTLTSTDAVNCGIAHLAGDLTDMGKQLAGGPWYECTREPWDIATATATAAEQSRTQQTQKYQHAMTHLVAASAAQSQIDSLRQQQLQLSSKIDSDHRGIEDLITKCNTQIDQITADYHNAVSQAEHQSNGAYLIATAKETARKQLADARADRDKAIAPLQADVDEATTEMNKLRKQVGDMIAGVSSSE
jgi:ATP-dependent protease ClpP protease subunit